VRRRSERRSKGSDFLQNSITALINVSEWSTVRSDATEFGHENAEKSACLSFSVES
jgi:hypothetical protein